MNSKSELRQLVDLISAEVQSIEDVYSSYHKPIPHLNDPNPEPFINDPVVTKSIFMVIVAASRLIKSVKNPFIATQEAASGMYSSALINVAVEANITEALREAGPKGMHIRDLAAKVAMDSGKLGQILRYLAAVEHIYREISPDVFINNRISSALDTGLPFEEAQDRDTHNYHFPQGCAAVVGHISDANLSGAALMSKTLLDPETRFTKDPARASFSRSKGLKGTLWDWFDLPENKNALHRFGSILKTWTKFTAVEEVTTAFDWGSLPTGSTIVDVGGGVGGCTAQLSRVFTHLRYVVQDRPETVENGEKLWKTTDPDALASGLVRFQVHDFFDSQPIENAAVYILRWVLHNWEDQKAQMILQKLRAAANHDTKLIVIEEIIPFTCPASDFDTKVAELKIGYDLPPILYGNPGPAMRTAFDCDMHMLNLYNSEERTAGQWIDLLKSSGWNVISVREGYPYAIISVPM